MHAGIGDVTYLEGCVFCQLLLNGYVSLPGIWSYSPRVLSIVGRDRRVRHGRRCVQRPVRIDVDDEWRRLCHTFIDANQLALEELAAAQAERYLSIAKYIPRDSNARSNIVVVLVDQSPVRSRRAVRQWKIDAKAREEFGSIRARSCSGNDNRTVAGIGRIGLCFRCAPGRRTPVRPMIVVSVRLAIERPPEAEVEGDISGDLPLICQVPLEVM